MGKRRRSGEVALQKAARASGQLRLSPAALQQLPVGAATSQADVTRSSHSEAVAEQASSSAVDRVRESADDSAPLVDNVVPSLGKAASAHASAEEQAPSPPGGGSVHEGTLPVAPDAATLPGPGPTARTSVEDEELASKPCEAPCADAQGGLGQHGGVADEELASTPCEVPRADAQCGLGQHGGESQEQHCQGRMDVDPWAALSDVESECGLAQERAAVADAQDLFR